MRRGRWLLLALSLTFVHAAPASAGTRMFVGAADDGARSLDAVRTKRNVDRAARAGLGVVRMTVLWSPGQDRVGGDDASVLRNATAAAQLDGVRLVVSVYPRDARSAPRTSRARGELAEFAASIARRFPTIADFVIGNEPNLNTFWMPQFGAGGVDLAARSYELLLARAYDALKSVSPDVNVIGGALSPRGQDEPTAARQTHSPTTFIRDLGRAYRASGRRKPIMDMFAIHPYLIPSRLPPSFAHPNVTTIGIADYSKLVRLLTAAFRGTAQRGQTLPIVYDEFGYQSKIPPAKRTLYTHLGSPAARDAISEGRQAAYYKQALALAACQPTVAGVLIFHVADERDARAWQSGLYYADGTAKSSLPPVRAAALAARDGKLGGCDRAKATSTLEDVAFRAPPADGATLAVDLFCSTPCSYRADVVDARTGAVVSGAAGKANGALTVTIPSDDLAGGDYQYALRVFKSGKPGTAETRYSRKFTVPGEPPPADDPASLGWLPESRWPLPTLLPIVPAPS